MGLTREFRETVYHRGHTDKAFRNALLTGAVNAYLGGDEVTAKMVLREIINPTIGFERLAAELRKPSKSLHRMLGPHGNPNAANFFAILRALQASAGVTLTVRAIVCRQSSMISQSRFQSRSAVSGTSDARRPARIANICLGLLARILHRLLVAATRFFSAARKQAAIGIEHDLDAGVPIWSSRDHVIAAGDDHFPHACLCPHLTIPVFHRHQFAVGFPPRRRMRTGALGAFLAGFEGGDGGSFSRPGAKRTAIVSRCPTNTTAL